MAEIRRKICKQTKKNRKALFNISPHNLLVNVANLAANENHHESAILLSDAQTLPLKLFFGYTNHKNTYVTEVALHDLSRLIENGWVYNRQLFIPPPNCYNQLTQSFSISRY
jgi:hypothetical protein